MFNVHGQILPKSNWKSKDIRDIRCRCCWEVGGHKKISQHVSSGEFYTDIVGKVQIEINSRLKVYCSITSLWRIQRWSSLHRGRTFWCHSVSHSTSAVDISIVHTLKTDPSAPKVPRISAETFCVVRQDDFGYKSSLCLFITFSLYFSLF